MSGLVAFSILLLLCWWLNNEKGPLALFLFTQETHQDSVILTKVCLTYDLRGGSSCFGSLDYQKLHLIQINVVFFFFFLNDYNWNSISINSYDSSMINVILLLSLTCLTKPLASSLLISLFLLCDFFLSIKEIGFIFCIFFNSLHN